MVRVVRQPDRARMPLGEGIVEDVVGPAEGGTGWAVAVQVGEALWVLPEDSLEAKAPGGVGGAERLDTLELRLVTDLTDGVQAARVAEQIESTLRALIGPSLIEITAERHWAEPFHYELDVNVSPLGDAVEAFRALAGAGRNGWLSCRDDGWRCDLWWSDDEDEAGFLVPEVYGAEVTFLPWSSPLQRPEQERPLVSV